MSRPASILSGRAAFLLGFTIGKRSRRTWSAREALEAHARLLDGSNVTSFLNGADDGASNDRWRYDSLRALIAEENAAVACAAWT